jgi:hypothetical protein
MIVPHSVVSPHEHPARETPMYERPIALEKDVLTRRIYAPLSYAPVRNAAVVPVVHSECVSLASWFPLVWRRRQATIQFVAVRALLNDQRAQPRAACAVLPLVLHAYPFMHDPDQPITADSRKMLDDVFADAPTDVGASITTVHHKLARATTTRFRILDRFAQESAVTAEIGRAIADRDLFEPWALNFDIGGHCVEVPDLLVIRSATFETGQFADLLRDYGMPCAQMLGLHRISLFRAGVLLAMAKTFFNGTHDGQSHGNEASEQPQPRPASPADVQLATTPS